ncbi:MAG: hypothetical protein MI866_11610, partial [Bacteroidales bacterium]|nr:hypothetical protein [Bacteroidales bacterium]
TDLNNFYTEETEIIEIEEWMTDLQSFYVEDEMPLEVEYWMTSLDEYTNTFDSYLFADADEVTLEVEDWMTDLNAYNKVDANEIEGIKSIDIENNCPVLIALKH